MGIEEIRKLAPEGATHYEIRKEIIYYYRRVGNFWYLVTIKYNTLDAIADTSKLKPLY